MHYANALAFTCRLLYNRAMETILLANNISQGAIVALKMMGGVAAAAVLLYLVLVLTKVLGGKLEQKKYEKYCETYRQEHGNEDGMLTKEAFVEERAKGNAVVWRREGKSQNMYNIPAGPATMQQPPADEQQDKTQPTEGDADNQE